VIDPRDLLPGAIEDAGGGEASERPPGDHGTAQQAIEYAICYHDPDMLGQEREFLQAWQTGDLSEWPEFYDWLGKYEPPATPTPEPPPKEQKMDAELRPCRYCGPGKYTGLPGNACENCMNTGTEEADPLSLRIKAAWLGSLPRSDFGDHTEWDDYDDAQQRTLWGFFDALAPIIAEVEAAARADERERLANMAGLMWTASPDEIAAAIRAQKEPTT
jgi:hypothetical protein